MNKTNLAEELRKLTTAPDPENFIYDLLLAYNLPKSSVTLLRNSDTNYLSIGGELTLRKKLFFRVLRPEQDPLTVRAEIREGMTQPYRFIVLTDYRDLYAYDIELDEALDCPLAELPDHYDFFLPWAGIEKTRHYDENPADVKAAERMARLFDVIKKENPDDSPAFVHDLNVFLSRVLFCFFAEDTGIFPRKNLFSNGIGSQTATDGHDLREYLAELFTVLDLPADRRTGVRAHFRDFPYVNGGLFRDRIRVPEFSPRSRRALIEAGTLDWAGINPDIFGSMIQAVVDAEKRGGLGMHYTSVPNIMKVIEPLFLDDLREAFANARGGRYERHELAELRKRLGKIKIFDPACGSGNFLIIAYKELRKLEMRIIQRQDELSGDADARLFEKGAGAVSTISLNQFYGIEIDVFAHEIAILALWLAEHQMNREFERVFGQTKPTLPLDEAGRIVHANACRVNWETVCPKEEGGETFILGNPPYLGARVLNVDQKSDMKYVFEPHNIRSNDLDYVAAWFFKSARYINNIRAKASLVATNSICQGSQVSLFWSHMINSVEIFYCYLPFKWANNAKDKAAVIVSVIGIRNIGTRAKKIYNKDSFLKVKNISPYLVDGDSVIVQSRSTAISKFPEMSFGSMANDGGFFFFSDAERQELLSNYPNAAKFIKKVTGSQEFINGEVKFCIWVEDSNLEEAITIPPIKKRIEGVKQHRLNSKRAGTRSLAETPHQFAEVRHSSSAQLVIPRVSSERRPYIPIGLLDELTIVKDSAFFVAGGSPTVFSVISSQIHMQWVQTVGGRLKSDYRYSNTIVYNTFPFPPITPAQEQRLTETALGILAAREQHPGSTLAELYDPDKMPENLRAAHRANDLAVEACYRLEPFTSDEERLAYLFKLYEEMIAAEREEETLFAARKKAKKSRKKKG